MLISICSASSEDILYLQPLLLFSDEPISWQYKMKYWTNSSHQILSSLNGGTHSVMAIIIGSGLGYSSSNSEQGCLHWVY